MKVFIGAVFNGRYADFFFCTIFAHTLFPFRLNVSSVNLFTHFNPLPFDVQIVGLVFLHLKTPSPNANSDKGVDKV